MTTMASLSVEIGHLYLGELNDATAQMSIQRAATWARPIVERYRKANLPVSITALVDDYFPTPKGSPTPQEAESLVRGAAEDADLPIDYLVFERRCAETVEHMIELIQEEPRPGAGSRGGPRDQFTKEGWLSNGDVMRQTYQPKPRNPLFTSATEDENNTAEIDLEPRYHHPLFLDQQLWQQQEEGPLWSCPALSAWWQLIRLGALIDENDNPSGVPAGTSSRANAPPFPAKRNLTVLDPRFIEVEHAVHTILRQVALPEWQVRQLKDSPEDPNPARAHLDRIGYLFVGSQFDHPKVR